MKLDKSHLFDYFLVLAGNFLVAFAVAGFILPNNILSGGLAGISVALYPVFHIDPELLITVLTFGFFLFGSVVLGKSFAVKTALSTIAYPFFLNIITLFLADRQLTANPILASLYGGVVLGLGVALVFRTGASTGGMDIPPLIVHKYTNIPLGTLVMITDGLTVLLGIATHSVEAALIGILSVWSSSYMVDKALSFGGQSTKSIFIISEHTKEILDMIHTELDRGATILKGVGGYSGEEKDVILVVIMNKQYPMLNKLVISADPNAFMIVEDAKEVKGNGFTMNLEENRNGLIKK